MTCIVVWIWLILLKNHTIQIRTMRGPPVLGIPYHSHTIADANYSQPHVCTVRKFMRVNFNYCFH